MKPGAGKGKGSEYEREVGRKISLWLTKGQRKDILCRTVLSGGQFTMSSTGNAGDLMGQHILADPFCSKTVIECKFWRDLEMIKFLNQEGDLYKALIKVGKEATAVGKDYWLVAKQNSRPDLLFMPVRAHPRSPSCAYHILFDQRVYMFKLVEFLEATYPDDYLARTKELPIRE